MEKFHILNQEIEFSTPKMNYCGLMLQYQQMAAEAGEQLGKEYADLGSLKVVAEKLEDSAEQLYYRVIRNAVSQLQMQGIYTVDEGELKKICGSFFYQNFVMKFDELVCDPYEEIMGEKQEAYEFRRRRKANRARMQGYGWGIGGTIRAGMTAGAMNMATGIGHSMMNSIGNAGTEMSASAKLLALYKNPMILEQLKDGLCTAITKIMPEIVKIIERNTNIAFEWSDSTALSEAQALSNNILKGNVPAERLNELIVKSLILNPFNLELYQYAVEAFGDENGEIEKMAEKFGYGLKTFKVQCIDKAYGDLNKRTYGSEEELLEEKEEIIQKCRYYGVNSLPYESILNGKWQEIDRALRTVEGKEYETREIAKNVEKDIITFREQCSLIDWNERDLTDSTVRKACEAEVREVGYLTEEFVEQIQRRLDEFLQPYIYRQNIIKKLADADAFLERFHEIVLEEEFYKAARSRFRFCDFAGDGKNKAPQLEDSGKAVLFEDLTLFGGWRKGIILTTRELIRYDKNQILRIRLEDITDIQVANGEIEVFRKDEKTSLGKMTGILEKNITGYAAFLHAAVVGIAKTDTLAVENCFESYEMPQKETKSEFSGEAAAELENAKNKLMKAVSLFGKFIK